VDAETILQFLHEGRLTTYPLGVLSVVVFAVALQRWWMYRGIEKKTRDVTRRAVDCLARRDVSACRAACEASSTPAAEIFLEGLRWQNIALEDLERVLATSRSEAVTNLRRGLWALGTIGSLSPFIGLFGTVWGIMRSFNQMRVQGAGGFDALAGGISEALIATAVGLFVAIVALALYNYLQVRVGHIQGALQRGCDRFIQALLYVESGAQPTPAGTEAPGGNPLPA